MVQVPLTAGLGPCGCGCIVIVVCSESLAEFVSWKPGGGTTWACRLKAPGPIRSLGKWKSNVASLKSGGSVGGSVLVYGSAVTGPLKGSRDRKSTRLNSSHLG